MLKEIIKLWKKDDLTEQSIKLLETMFIVSEDLFSDALKSTSDETKQVIADIKKKDKEINEIERLIRKQVLEHLSINPSQDLSSSLVLLGVANDLERIGDYSKNIFELNDLSDRDKIQWTKLDMLKEVESNISSSFSITRNAFLNSDSAKAKELIELLHKQNKACDEILSNVLKDDSYNKQTSAFAVLMARYLKRVSAHLKSINSSVVRPFQKIGYFPQED